LFALAIFPIGFHDYAQASLDHNLTIYASHVAGMTGMHYHTQLLLVVMKSLELFAWAGLEL
jgi:hypothetical protein